MTAKDNSGLIYQTIKRASLLAQKLELLTKRVEELERKANVLPLAIISA